MMLAAHRALTMRSERPCQQIHRSIGASGTADCSLRSPFFFTWPPAALRAPAGPFGAPPRGSDSLTGLLSGRFGAGALRPVLIDQHHELRRGQPVGALAASFWRRERKAEPTTMRSVLLSMRQGPVQFPKKTDHAAARSVVSVNVPRLAACAKRLIGMRFVLSGAAACVLTAVQFPVPSGICPCGHVPTGSALLFGAGYTLAAFGGSSRESSQAGVVSSTLLCAPRCRARRRWRKRRWRSAFVRSRGRCVRAAATI
jgi:hypothetical protein